MFPLATTRRISARTRGGSQDHESRSIAGPAFHRGGPSRPGARAAHSRHVPERHVPDHCVVAPGRSHKGGHPAILDSPGFRTGTARGGRDPVEHARRARRSAARTASALWSRAAFSVLPCEIALEPRNAAQSLVGPAVIGDRRRTDDAHHIIWQGLPANINPDRRAEAKLLCGLHIAQRHRSIASARSRCWRVRDLDAGQCAIPDAVSARCRCLPRLAIHPEKPTLRKSYRACLNAHFFALLVCRVAASCL